MVGCVVLVVCLFLAFGRGGLVVLLTKLSRSFVTRSCLFSPDLSEPCISPCRTACEGQGDQGVSGMLARRASRATPRGMKISTPIDDRNVSHVAEAPGQEKRARPKQWDSGAAST